jgi:NADP-dependent 3-hydroxy acid dehydrogenase YdfG
MTEKVDGSVARELAGRRVVVTGASSGIGESTVRLCAAQGAHVAAVARRGDRLRQLADEVAAIPVVADLAEPEGPAAAVAQAAEQLGGIDVLVNNAGVYLLGGLAEGRMTDWRRMFDINVLAVLGATQAALPHLQESSAGHVVNVSSVGGRRVARTSTAVYSATKFALYAVSEGMRQELHPQGVRVSVVSPGVVQTELGVGTADAELLTELQAKQASLGIGPDAVARAVVFALNEPPDVAVFEMVVLPTAQPV